MKKEVKKTIKYATPIIVLLILLISLIVMPYIIEHKPFIIGADIRTQHRLFFEEFKTLISTFVHEGKFPFWSWNFFLGNNFWASKSYYILSDIFAYISLLFDNHYYNILMLQTVLKLSLSVLTFLVYCRTRKFNYATSVILSFCWGFSAWALNFANQPIFLYFYSLLPLYFSSIELFFNNKKKYLYSIVVGIMLITNYYLFFTLSIFTVVYYLYRYYEINGTLKKFQYYAINMIFYYIVGALCTALIIVPSFMYIINNNRVGTFSSQLVFWKEVNTYFQLLISPFYPTNIYVNRLVTTNGIARFSSMFNTLEYSTREILLWSGSVTYFLVINGIYDINKLYRRANRVYIIFITLLALFPLLSSIVHGLSEVSFRWTMFAIFMNLMISARYLDNIDLVVCKIVRCTLFFSISIILLIMPLCSYIYGYNIIEYSDQYIKMVVIVPIIVVIAYALLRRNIHLVLLLVVIELGYSAYMTFNDNPYYKEYDWNFVYSAEHVLGNRDDLTNYIDLVLNNEDIYRVFVSYKDVYWYYSLNMNLIYNFQSVNTYDSTYSSSLNDLLLLYEFDNPTSWTWELKQKDLIDFISVKYALVNDENELPHDQFAIVGNFQGINIYENLNYRTIANNYNRVVPYEFAKKNYSTSLINEAIICYEDDYFDIEEYVSDTNLYEAYDIVQNHNSLKFKINSDSKTFVVVSIPYDKGWEVRVDSMKTEIYKVNGGFMGFGIKSNGIHNIEMTFIPYGLKEGAFLSLASLFIFVGLVLREELFK